MRLIDADAFIKMMEEKCDHTASLDEWVLAVCRGGIKAMPTVVPEQPEIIRCKDCKHRHLDGMIWNCPFGLSGGEDFFCAYGVKDGDEE